MIKKQKAHKAQRGAMSGYQKIIWECLTKIGRTDVEPHRVEGLMRLQYGTLDHLSREEFMTEARLCVAVVDAMGGEMADENARSYGLIKKKKLLGG